MVPKQKFYKYDVTFVDYKLWVLLLNLDWLVKACIAQTDRQTDGRIHKLKKDYNTLGPRNKLQNVRIRLQTCQE